MEPDVVVALIAAAAVVGAAWIANRRTHGAVRRIESEFQPNGGSSTKDALNRIEKSQTDAAKDIAYLAGRFDQHVTDTTAARTEGTHMWRAVEAVAQAMPPQPTEETK